MSRLTPTSVRRSALVTCEHAAGGTFAEVSGPLPRRGTWVCMPAD